jgi:hypothetical protein
MSDKNSKSNASGKKSNKASDKGGGNNCEDPNINEFMEAVQKANILRAELYRLPLDPWEQIFIGIEIAPLLSVMDLIGRVSYDLSYSANFLSNTAIVRPRKNKIRDTIYLLYDINEQCQDIYYVLKERINCVLKDAR